MVTVGARHQQSLLCFFALFLGIEICGFWRFYSVVKDDFHFWVLCFDGILFGWTGFRDYVVCYFFQLFIQ